MFSDTGDICCILIDVVQDGLEIFVVIEWTDTVNVRIEKSYCMVAFWCGFVPNEFVVTRVGC